MEVTEASRRWPGVCLAPTFATAHYPRRTRWSCRPQLSSEYRWPSKPGAPGRCRGGAVTSRALAAVGHGSQFSRRRADPAALRVAGAQVEPLPTRTESA